MPRLTPRFIQDQRSSVEIRDWLSITQGYISVIYFYDSRSPMISTVWNDVFENLLASYSKALASGQLTAARADISKDPNIAINFTKAPTYGIFWGRKSVRPKYIPATNPDATKVIEETLERSGQYPDHPITHTTVGS
ncbi:hypothetical protein TWF718_005755 [Orbilia javanica]|uniref:Uncharacterized protein n=1 Tax=Orbilia javanica TaxID=47235 RepID=A0AAN8RDS5_9PEZI